MWNIVMMITDDLPTEWEVLRVLVYVCGLYFVGKLIFFFIDIAAAGIKPFFRGR